MTRTELHAAIDDILELPIGTIQGDERLASLGTWDSLAIVSYIATCNGLFGVVLSGDQVKAAKTVGDLAALVAPHLSA